MKKFVVTKSIEKKATPELLSEALATIYGRSRQGPPGVACSGWSAETESSTGEASRRRASASPRKC
jgi:hypothetical protein